MDLRKTVGPLLALVVAAGVGGGIYLSAQRKAADDRARIDASQLVTVRGMIGSEKEGFFTDPRVIEALRKKGLVVHIEKVGSRQISLRSDVKNYDFGFPAGAPGAIKLQETVKARQSFNPFFTIMAIASWKSLLPVLEANGIVRQESGYYGLDMRGLTTRS